MIKKFSARVFGTRIIFFNTFHYKFTVFHKDLLFETYTDMNIMINKVYNQIHTCVNFSMFDWSGKNGNKSGKSQGILISCVSGYPVLPWAVLSASIYQE